MRLILKVLSYKGLPFPSEKTVEFNRQGGVIGRHADNTLVLEDMDKIVSGRHAEIVFENEQFQIKDTSTNGTYLLKADRNVSNSQTVLQNNEILRIGEYEILAEIISECSVQNELNFDEMISPSFSGSFDSAPGGSLSVDPFATDRSPFHDNFSMPPIQPAENPPKDSADYFKGLDSLSAVDIFSEPVAAPGAPISVDPFANDRSPFHDSFSMPPIQPAENPQKDFADYFKGLDSLPAADVFSEPVAESEAVFAFKDEPLPEAIPRHQPAIEDPFKPVSENRPLLSREQEVQDNKDLTAPSAAKPAGQSAEHALQLMHEFLAGAGIKDENFLTPQQWSGVMRSTGSLFRCMVEGLMDVLRARAEMKSEFRVSVTTLRSANNNPLKFNPDVEHVLKLMIGPPNPAFINAKEAVNEAFRDIKYHQIAMTAGIQASLAEILHKFDPEGFEKVYSEGMVFQKKAKCWDLFCEKYPEYKSQSQDEFFGDAFAEAYEKQMRLLGKS